MEKAGCAAYHAGKDTAV
ncbi:hypothetical protein SS209_01394 [Salmonella enterica subsp. enterica serovar Senftenberg str. SS209]|nr:hypothetical protein SS209_01394 [Salmonella enterica subsp. enterica serovar Senftenberg str. SS209]